MYSTVALLKNSKTSGRLVGTHQKLDKISRKCLDKQLNRVARQNRLKMVQIIDQNGKKIVDNHPNTVKNRQKSTKFTHNSPDYLKNPSATPNFSPIKAETSLPKITKIPQKIHLRSTLPSGKPYFPTSREILYFEGVRGPDGIKRKSPGVDEPAHFIIPEKPETHPQLLTMILDHQYNLRQALKNENKVRASFEAAWMAHAITDGLTPAHHFPLKEAVSELMSDKEFIKIFGSPIKGVMRGEDFLETVRNNWRYWGTNGYMSRHIAFEYGVAMVATAVPNSNMTPVVPPEDFENIDLERVFLDALYKIHALDMYNRFGQEGWTRDLARETTEILLPEIARVIILGWASCLPEEGA